MQILLCGQNEVFKINYIQMENSVYQNHSILEGILDKVALIYSLEIQSKAF